MHAEPLVRDVCVPVNLGRVVFIRGMVRDVRSWDVWGRKNSVSLGPAFMLSQIACTKAVDRYIAELV